MKVWITKYALTQGINEVEAEICATDMIMVKARKPRCFNEYYYGEGKEWHRNRESALKRAEEMRTKKLSSLERQIEKLKKLKFE